MIQSISDYRENCIKRTPIIPQKKSTNYRVFSQLKTDYFVKQGETCFPALEKNLNQGKNVVETLYIIDRIQENKTGDAKKLYPSLSKYNKTKSAEEQTFLAGIYRKTLIPDAFGPLVAMLVQNAITPPASYFDPNEEIGGAIVEYLKQRCKPLYNQEKEGFRYSQTF